MPGEPLIESLGLDLQPAFDALEPLGEKLTELASDFGAALADAIGSLPNVQAIPADEIIDGPGISDAISTAVGDTVPPPVPVDADTTILDSAIADIFDEPRPPIPVDGDATDLTTAIEDAVSTTATVPVDADTTDAQAALDALGIDGLTVPVDADVSSAQAEIDALQGEPVVLPVEADTGDAQDAFNALGESATGAVGGGSDGVGGLSHAIEGLAEVSEIASGETQGLISRIAGIGPSATAAVGGLVAVGVFIGEVTHLAADAEAQNKRFTDTFGALDKQVRNINVGGLSISLEDLGKKSATSSTDLEATASKIGQLGKSSGATGPQIVKTTQDLLALGATIAVNNPRLGDAASVTDRLSTALARGGRALTPYNISLTRSQIIHEAFNETGKTSVQALTQFELTTAGATLAVQKYGDTLGSEFAKGADNAQVKIKALKVQLEETLAAIGVPLLDPVTKSMSDLLPVAEQVGIVLGQLVEAALPLITSLAPILGALSGPLGLVADGVHAIGTALNFLPAPLTLAIGFVGLMATTLLVALVPALEGAIPTLASFGVALDLATGPIGIAVLAIAALGAAVRFFGHDNEEAAKAKKKFDDALFGTAAGGTFSAQIADLDANINKFAKDVVEGAAAGSDFRKALDGAGGGVAGVNSALTGTNAQFENYIARLKDSFGESLKARNEADALASSIRDQRDALIESEKGQVANLLSTDQLHAAEVGHLEGIHRLSDGTIDYVAVLKDADLIIQKHKAAQDEAAHSAAVAGTAYTDLATSIREGKTTALDAADVATKLGISTADATTIINDQVKALDGQKDKQIESTDAAHHLRDELAAGRITTSEAETGFLQLGVSIQGTTAFIGEATSAVESFISAATGGLPDAASALSSFEKNTSKAQSALDSATKRQSDVINKVQQDTQAAYDKIAVAQQRGGANVASAVRTAENHFADVAAAGKKKIDEAGIDVIVATDKLNKAAVPQELIDTLQKNLTDIANFETNLKTIVRNGGTELAEAFARQGPQVAAAQATAFANDPRGTKQAEALIRRGEGAKSQYTHWLEATFGPQVSAAAQKAADDAFGGENINTAVATSVTKLTGVVAQRFNPDFTKGASASVRAAAVALAGDASVSDAAGQVGLRALAAVQEKFGPIPIAFAVQVALNAAGAAMNDPSLPGATADAAARATSAFKPDFTPASSAAVKAAELVITADGTIDQAAGQIGVRALVAYEAKFGPVPMAQGTKIALQAARDAMDSDTALPEAAAGVGQRATDRFDPSFSHRVPVALQAAAVALANDKTVSEAAGQKGIDAVEAFKGTLTPEKAVTIAIGAAHDALAKDSTLAVKATEKGKETADGFGKGADFKKAASDELEKAAKLIPGLQNVPNVAGGLGVDAGEAFGQGLANGLDEKTSVVAAAADRLAATVTTHVAQKHGTTSPSKVAIRLGHEFAAGLAIGITDGEQTVGAASTELADEVIARLQRQLDAGLAKAAAAADAQKAIDQIVSSAVGQLPDASSAISTTSSDIASALSEQKSAFDAYHKAYATYADDKARLHKLEDADGVFQRQLAAANASLRSAQAKLFTDTAAGNTAALEADQRALDAAQTRIAGLNDRFKTSADQVRSDQAAIGQAATALSTAQKALETATDPATLVKNVKTQNAQAKQFLADLVTLVKRGDVDLAKQLADQGVDAAGRIARGLASSPAKAKQAEAAIDNAAIFADRYQAALERLFGASGDVTKAAATAGESVGVSLTTGLDKTVNTGTKQALDQIGKAQIAVPKVPVTVQPEVGNIDAQIRTALLAHGAVGVDLAPRIAALPPLDIEMIPHLATAIPTIAPLDVDVTPHLAALPPLEPLHVEVIPHLQALPVAAPFVAGAPVASQVASAPTTLALDLTVVLESGQTVSAQVEVPVPAGPRPSLRQLVQAEVHAS